MSFDPREEVTIRAETLFYVTGPHSTLVDE